MKFAWFLLGVLVGGSAVAGGGYFYLQSQEQDQHQFGNLNFQQPGVIKNLQNLNPHAVVGDLKKKFLPDGRPGPEQDDMSKILALGKEFVSDLEQNRLASAYRSTAEGYQASKTRPDFDEMVVKHPGLRRLNPALTSRVEKARKGADGKWWEYYFTGKDSAMATTKDMINVALTFTKGGSEWQIIEVEITDEAK